MLQAPRKRQTAALLASSLKHGVRGVATVNPPPWRPATVLDEWVQKEARPISLRQLTFFSRSLTESRLLSSANYIRTELPTRIAHRLRDMQTLPFVMVTNQHVSMVYELYYKAFDTFRRVPEIKSIEENQAYCEIVSGFLQEHLTVIPRLAMGILECQDLMNREAMDKFMNTLLRSRISRRVLAEHHLALTESFNASPQAASETSNPDSDFVGKVLLKCNAQKVLEDCGAMARQLAKQQYGPSFPIPEIRVDGHLDATFPYILSHLEYIVGELLRNSLQAVIERFSNRRDHMPAIEVLVCESPQHVIVRISDQGGGIPREILPHIWSFTKGPRRERILENLHQVPKMAATMQELKLNDDPHGLISSRSPGRRASSLGSLTSRPPELKLGVGLPMSRVYAEYWAGSLELHSLEGYGVDAFLQIPKLGNRNEQLTTRAIMDSV